MSKFKYHIQYFKYDSIDVNERKRVKILERMKLPFYLNIFETIKKIVMTSFIYFLDTFVTSTQLSRQQKIQNTLFTDRINILPLLQY